MAATINATSSWPANAPQPVPTADCQEIIAYVADAPRSDPKAAAVMAHELLANWPYLDSTKQDLKVYVKNLTIVFAEYSIGAGRRALDPIKGLVGQCDRYPPSIAALRQALEEFDERHKRAARAAQWILEEAKRRGDEAERQKLIDAERAEFRAKHPGKTPLDLLREKGIAVP